MKKLILVVILILLNACSPGTSAPATIEPESPPPAEPPSATAETAADPFTANAIELNAPACDGSLTPAQTEGPYYTPDTPERNSLLEAGVAGTRLLVVGYVLDTGCRPVSRAWLDFWQADGNGEYDNQAYRLRGHQFTDAQGRFFLETVMPGLYPERPVPHIHVKVRLPDGEILTTQLYFPDQPVAGLTVEIEDRGEYRVAYFNFVLE